MPRRWVVASVVALFVVAATVVAVALAARPNGVDGSPAPIALAGGQAIGPAATTAPPSASPNTAPSASPSPSASPTTTVASPSAKRSAPAAAPGGAPLAGRIAPGVTRSGVATFYDADGGGACGYDPGPDPLTAAMNQTDFEGSRACGAYILVQGANGASVTVRITNLCPAPCRVGQLDLSPAAFDHLGARNLGEIPITWKLANPPLSKRISVRYKTGSSQYWCGIQVIDHRNPVARLEVRAGGGWKQLQRTDYNYFLSENGAGCGGAIAVTDIYGERLVVDPLPVKADVIQLTTRQFAQH
ncbi:expansin EXLX1 family cellulose-binding protein [Amycolatopsis sp. NPDC051128]|uniref:expansin EXLX1 family cellulose-binding protein n=1 Tax=Amycolatopsis sp. NPDC051128 TaxID=3155412 RepID=UPI0034176B83